MDYELSCELSQGRRPSHLPHTAGDRGAGETRTSEISHPYLPFRISSGNQVSRREKLFVKLNSTNNKSGQVHKGWWDPTHKRASYVQAAEGSPLCCPPAWKRGTRTADPNDELSRPRRNLLLCFRCFQSPSPTPPSAPLPVSLPPPWCPKVRPKLYAKQPCEISPVSPFLS